MRILIADDHEVVRDGVRDVLENREGVQVVGEAANGKEAIEAASELQPDLIIMDWSMPVVDGLSAAQIIKKQLPETAIVMFSMFADKHFTEVVRNVGLNGLVSKEGDGPALLSAIDAVKQNQTYFPVL
jgi:two-component system, NarL family, nitrate/nitrite response regulator NarL